MKGAIAKLRGNMYEAAADIIDKWAQDNIYTDMIVTLAVNGEIRTEYICPNYNIYTKGVHGSTWEWEFDWWEGEQDVWLLGFRPLEMIHCFGYPKGKEVLWND